MLGRSLLALAALAGQTVVDAAAANDWETAQRRFALLLGRGDARQTRLAEQRLEETREKLIGAAETDVGLIRMALRAGWAGWLADFLEENPDTEADLQTLIQEIQTVLPAESVSASNHAVSANGAVSSDAAQGPGPEHPGALAARSEIAYSTGQAGDAGTARDQFAALLPISESVFGPDHPDTLAARFNLAYWTGRAGDAAAARDQFAALLPVRERVRGPEHAETLAVWYQLAHWAALAKDAATAQE